MSRESDVEQYRFFLKDTIRKQIDFTRTDQAGGVPPPPMEKPPHDGGKRVDLAPVEALLELSSMPVINAIRNRRSRRRFSNRPLTLEEISLLLWATQGVRDPSGSRPMMRTVPSAGARHALETYLAVMRVDKLDAGIYRYLPLEHQLLFLFKEPSLAERVTEACFGQSFAGAAAATFIWTAIPYRTEWRYGLAAHKVIAIDAGHVGQNLYLACEAIGAGTCAIAAYDQQKADALLRVDGEDEFTVYIAPVGEPAQGQAHGT